MPSDLSKGICKALATVAVAAIVVIAAIPCGHMQARAMEAAGAAASEFSARKQKQATKPTSSKRKVRYTRQPRAYYPDPRSDPRSPYYLRPGVAPSFGYIGPPGYAGEYAWRRSIGQCVVDLGYGRWAPCDGR